MLPKQRYSKKIQFHNHKDPNQFHIENKRIMIIQTKD